MSDASGRSGDRDGGAGQEATVTKYAGGIHMIGNDLSLRQTDTSIAAGEAIADALVEELRSVSDEGKWPQGTVDAITKMVVKLVTEAHPFVSIVARGRARMLEIVERVIQTHLRGPAVAKIVQAEVDRILREIAKEEIDRREESVRAIVATMVADDLSENGKRVAAEAATECVERIRRKLLAGA